MKSGDLTSITAGEPEAITAAKERIIEIITEWSAEDPPIPPTA